MISVRIEDIIRATDVVSRVIDSKYVVPVDTIVLKYHLVWLTVRRTKAIGEPGSL